MDIAKELEDINSDIVNHVYHAEFNEIKAAPPSTVQHNDQP